MIDKRFLHEEGEGEDYGPLAPETIEALKEHGIEFPMWKPVIPARALVAEWRRTRAFDILTINAKTGTWRRPWWLFRALRLYVLRWIG